MSGSSVSEALDSATVRCRLRSGEYILQDKDGARSSAVWERFKLCALDSRGRT